MENTPRKIAHITTIDLSLRYLLLNQLVALKNAGYDVVSISKPGENVKTLNEEGIRHIPVNFTRSFSPVADLFALWQLFRILRREQFQLVHTHTPKPGLLGQLAARLARVPIVVNTVHGYYFHDNMPGHWRRFYIGIEKIAARLSSLVFFVNEEDMLTAVREGICAPERMKRLGPGGIGIDIRRFDRSNLSPAALDEKRTGLAIPSEAKVVGFVGRLVAEKGVNELLQAAQIVRQTIPQVRFLLIGPIDDEKADALTPSVANHYGVADICIFPGMRQDIHELMALMDVFVLPSHREGFPVVPMEASAMGVPCIVTDVRGCREVIEHGRNGLTVPLADVDALSTAIIKVLSNRVLAKGLGEMGRQIAEERFDEQVVFRNVETEYARLFRENGIEVAERCAAEAVNT